MNLKNAFALFKDTFREWSEDRATRLGAAVAYYTIFSLAPLLVVIIGVAGLLFGAKAVQGDVVGQIEGMVGHDAAQTIQTMIASANHPATGIFATIVGLITVVLGASGLFGELQDSLDTIWKVAPKPRGLLATVRAKVLSFSMVLGIAFLLLVSLVISAGVALIGQFLGNVLPVPEVVLHVINFVVSFGIVTLLFAMIYKILPDAEIAWRDVWIGAAITSLLFAIGQLVIGLYLGHSGTTSTFGASGALVVILLWVFYSAQILFFGAEFTQVYANRYGNKVRPSPGAISIAKPATPSNPHPDTRPADELTERSLTRDSARHPTFRERLVVRSQDGDSIVPLPSVAAILVAAFIGGMVGAIRFRRRTTN